MAENENEGKENEGMSTGKKVVAGAAIGVAVPAAVGVAKKLIGDSDDQEEGGGAGGSRQGGRSAARSSSSSRSRSSGTRKRTGSTAKSGSQRTRSRSTAKSGSQRTRSTSSSSRRSSSSSGGGSNRTKEQLYNQAKRLGIEGRSTMTKAQLERAINRARSRS